MLSLLIVVDALPLMLAICSQLHSLASKALILCYAAVAVLYGSLRGVAFLCFLTSMSVVDVSRQQCPVVCINHRQALNISVLVLCML